MGELHRYFVEADASGNGVLSWKYNPEYGNEIYNFCLLCFDRMGLPRSGLGGDHIFHSLYHRFDLDNSSSLSERECLCMIDTIIRAIARTHRKTDPDESSDTDLD